MSLWLIGLFFVFMLVGVPISVALGLASVLVLIIFHPVPLAVIPQTMYVTMDSFIMVAVPLFVLAGMLMESGGIAHRIFAFAHALVGHWRGGLGHVNVLSSMLFGGMSGSSVADAASLAPIEIAAMTRHKYPLGYAASVSVASSTLAVIIPPSILLVVAGATAGQSIGKLLLGGFLPGLVMSASMMIANYLICVKRGYGEVEKFSWRRLLPAFFTSLPALVAPLVLMSGILFGIFTPTEAAGAAVIYTLLIGIFFYREFKLKDIPRVLINATKASGTILFIAITAKIATFIFTIDGLPQRVAAGILAVSHNPQIVVGLIVAFLLIVGMFMDVMAALLVLIPILFPIGVQLGFDPIHFLMIIVASLAMGLITPPVGACLFAICNVTKLSIEDLTRESLPMIAAVLVALLLIVYVPQITLLLPNLFWKG